MVCFLSIYKNLIEGGWLAHEVTKTTCCLQNRGIYFICNTFYLIQKYFYLDKALKKDPFVVLVWSKIHSLKFDLYFIVY